MRKISYYVIAIVLAGIAVISFWVYQRYFRAAEQQFLYFAVDRGDIQEAVKVRGEVVAQKEFDLEFPFSGTVAATYVKDGETVSSGQRLMTLDTKGLDIQAGQLSSVVAEHEADLTKLLTGATPEEVSVSESELAGAAIAAGEAKANLADKIRDTYTKSDDAVRSKTDELFDSPRSANPSLIATVNASSATRNSLDAVRPVLENMLNAWQASLSTLSASSDLAAAAQTAEQNAASVSAYLDTLSQVVSSLTVNSTISQATIDSYKADVSAARTNMSAATASLVAAEEKAKLADADVALAEKELAFLEAPARPEDVAAAQARVSESEGQLAAVEEQIAKSTLYAPSAGKVSKVQYEVGEVFRPGTPAVSMVTDGYKLQADVSELEIAKINETDGNDVRIALDSFPGVTFSGKVVSVDAKEVIKTEDKYYRVNMVFDAEGATLRSGMSADVAILSVVKPGVLRVPALAIYTDGATKYVKVLAPGLDKAASEASLKRVEVETGITDGDYVEVLGGLTEGQTVVVSAE